MCPPLFTLLPSSFLPFLLCAWSSIVSPLPFLCLFTNYLLQLPGCFMKQPGKVGPPFPFPLFFCLHQSTDYILRLPGYLHGSQGCLQCPALGGVFSVPGCSCGSQGGLRCPSLGGQVFRSLAARGAARRVYGTLCSAGTVACPWLLCEAAREAWSSLSLPPLFRLLLYTNNILRLSGCLRDTSSQGDLQCPALGRRVFRSLAARAAAREVYGVPRSAGDFFGSWLLARQPGGFTASCARQAQFSVPSCFAKQPGKVCPPFPFPLFFVYFYILRIYFGSLAACGAAREVLGIPRSAGAVYGVPRSTASFSVAGCSRSSQEGLQHPVLGRHGFLSLAALGSSRGRLVLPFPSPFFSFTTIY